MIDLAKLKKEFENELFDSVLPFWEKCSMDTQDGGYFNCIDRDGTIYDTTKYMWLHGRQVWMFSKLYNSVAHESKWKKIAEHGIKFMHNNAVDHSGRVFFSLNKQGKPIYRQRKIFSECFYAMAMAEYARLIDSDELLNKAKRMIGFINRSSKDKELIGRPSFSGEYNLQSLAIPMMLLNVIEQVYANDYQSIRMFINECISQVKSHFIDDTVYENVTTNGKIHNSSAGRLLNPGHAIEAGWFIKHWSIKLADKRLAEFSTKMIKSALIYGWDQEYKGLYYFLDSKGYSPTQLEWNMKLWWPHCEALYATLLLYSETKSQHESDLFKQIKDYTFTHFPDPKYGEWYGYLDRYGKVTHRFKGGPYKGCFHVPRSLFLCWLFLDRAQKGIKK